MVWSGTASRPRVHAAARLNADCWLHVAEVTRQRQRLSGCVARGAERSAQVLVTRGAPGDCLSASQQGRVRPRAQFPEFLRPSSHVACCPNVAQARRAVYLATARSETTRYIRDGKNRPVTTDTGILILNNCFLSVFIWCRL